MYGKSSLVFTTLNSDILYSVKGRQGLQHFIYTNIILAVKVLHMKPLNLEQKIVYRYTSYLCQTGQFGELLCLLTLQTPESYFMEMTF